jgi:hypothetical protein
LTVRRTEIPRDIFFSDDDDDNDDDGAAQEVPEVEPQSETQRAPEAAQKPGGGEEGTSPEDNGGSTQKTEKMQVSVYLTKPTARKLDAVRFQLQYDYDVKLSKSDLAEFAIGRLDRNIDEIIEAAENGAFDW